MGVKIFIQLSLRGVYRCGGTGTLRTSTRPCTTGDGIHGSNEAPSTLDEEMTNGVHVREERAAEAHPPTPPACWADTGGKLGLLESVKDPSSLVSIRCPTD